MRKKEKEERGFMRTSRSSLFFHFLFILFILFFLVVPSVNAQREFVIQEDSQGITVNYPKIFYLKQGKNYTFRANPINNSDGSELTNTTTDCRFTLVSSEGDIIRENEMHYYSPTGYFKRTLGSNISTNGEISYSYYCNTSERAGFVSVQAYITPTGLSPTLNDTFYFVFLALATILGIVMYILQAQYNKYLSIFSALSFIAGGIIVYTYPSMIEGELVTKLVSLVYYGIGLAILGANVIYDWLPEGGRL